jgi:virulence-associated protein VapD
MLMTETLAKVYLEQKKYQKAIQAYEILILKYPEKISFFADRISDIKILQQNNNN